MLELVLLAPLAGFVAALPLPREAHEVVLTSVFGVPAPRTQAVTVARLIAAVTMFVAARRAYGKSLGRAKRREAIGLAFGLVLGLVGAAVLRQLTAELRLSPVGMGAGFLLTGVSLATVRVAPGAHASTPPARSAIVIGCALALSGLPCGAAVASAAVALAWSGRRVTADAMLALAAPLELAATLAEISLPGLARLADAGGAAVFGLALTLGAAVAGVVVLRRGLEGVARVAPPWLAIVGVAELAMAWALGAG